MRIKLLLTLFCIILLSCLLSCSIPSPIIPGSGPGDTNYEVYRPEIIDDGKPEVPGNYHELNSSKNLNLHQKCLLEALYFNYDNLNMPDLFIQDLGITNLNLLSNYEGTNREATFYSTRLKNIDGLKGFKELTAIIIRGSDMEDFSALAELPKLKELDVSYCNAKDLSSLSGCISLERLTIDEESGFSLEPLKDLITEHLNHESKATRLNITRIKGKLKTYRVVPNIPTFGKVTSKLKGAYNLAFADFHFIDEKGNSLTFNSVFISGSSSGSLLMGDSDFTFILKDTKDSNLSFSLKGTYTSIGNLIYFKTNDGVESVKSFKWGYNLGFRLIDRTPESVKHNFIRYSLEKVKDEIE